MGFVNADISEYVMEMKGTLW